MAGLLEFAARFGTEEQYLEHLAGLRWLGGFVSAGFVCTGCGGRPAWQLKARPQVYECTACHRQESVTAGTVFHRTRTGLSKWFLAAFLMGRDKRGVSAKFLQPELGVAYQTAWTMAHKLRHGLSEDPARPLHGLLEADETPAFSKIKAWLVGTHHGVSAKHLPRYLREWSYRFNRRNLPNGLDGYLNRRAVECTYDRSAARRFGVSVSTAIGWAPRWRAAGHAQPRAMGGDQRSRLLEHRTAVVALVATPPDLTVQEIRGALAAGHGISVGLTSLWRFLRAQNITLKKRACTPPSRIAPT
jgi:transposase